MGGRGSLPPVGKTAAFFDLDRTVLRRASGPLISEALATAGVVPSRGAGVGGVFYRVYDVIGETLPSMAMARAAALIARGWPADTVRQAGRDVADRLENLVAPYARPLIKHHQDMGHVTVLATTTPMHLIAPFAEKMGFDDVVATRYAERDGSFTGSLEGEFVWARGKLSAVRRWSESNGVDLKDSFAYSDSFYDLPLLGAVGQPAAVNPDPRLLAVATLRRWPVLNLDAPPGVVKVGGVELMDLVRWVSNPAFIPFARFDIQGTEHIPATGPVIVVSNHRSYFDFVAMGLVVLGRGRNLRFLGKKEVFDAPVVGSLAKAAGGIRVDRGTGSTQPLEEAASALAGGEAVAILPQGTIPRGKEFFEPKLKGKTGAARLAAMTGAPVVPIGLWGTEEVWPRRLRVPRVHQVVSPPKIQVRVGPAVELAGEDPHADTEAIMAAITALLPAEARRRRRPTREQIIMATPANVPVEA